MPPREPEAAASRLSHDRAPPDWDKVGQLSLDPGAVPDEALLRGLIEADASLIGHAPGSPARLSLDECEGGAVAAGRVQSCEGTNHQMEDRGDGIPNHRPFPQMLDAANRFIDTRVEYIGTRQKHDLAINPYFGQTAAMLDDGSG
jgi:hypothetical protein